MEIERVEFLQRGVERIRQHIHELDLDTYTKESHFLLLGRRILGLPGIIDDHSLLSQGASVSFSGTVGLELKCEYTTPIPSNDPQDMKSISALWIEKERPKASPLVSQKVRRSSSVEALFSMEQTIVEIEINQGIIPDPELVVYKNEPSYLSEISQQ